MTLRIYGKRSLKTLPGLATRPTPSRVREALFHIWRADLPHCRWLDICAGVGTMGAEALARGAAFVAGIEKSGSACRVIEQNWRAIAHPPQQFQLERGDARKVLSKFASLSSPFDCIYFDPPYASDLYLPVLDRVSTLGLLAPDGQMAVESDLDRSLPETIARLIVNNRRTYGKTVLTLYQQKCSE
ncbi:MAG: 16S rRNA (guanine(966)-N(2))-methyltransferase RsmD [Cyanobacteria bacterium P01_D01_bin.123]